MVGLKRNPKKRRIYAIFSYKRHLKWLLWFCAFVYFFTSYRISSSSSSISPTRFISFTKRATTSFASLALIEPSGKTRKTRINVQDGLLGSDLKVYIYDLPSKFHKDWLSDDRCGDHLFAAEVAIHEALLASEFRTHDPFEADFFFVPVYVSCNFSTLTGFPSLAHARQLLSSAVDLVSSQMPFWNQSGGSDHIFVASHDYGACFHAVEDLAIADGIPEFLKKSIVLQTFGVKGRHPCQEVEHVLIPPYVRAESVEMALKKKESGIIFWKKKKKKKREGDREIWAFFRGKMEMHPKNISGRIYGNGVRTAIWKKYSRNRKFFLKRKRFAGYQSEMARSVFCLCPLGWAPWSPRLVESVALGCVPVIIADGIRLPFPSSVPWPNISLSVAQKDVPKLSRFLDRVASTNLSAIQRNLWNPLVRRALLYHRDGIQFGDATWHVLEELSGRLLHRSHRRARLRVSPSRVPLTSLVQHS